MHVSAHITSGFLQQQYKSSTRPFPQQCSIPQRCKAHFYCSVLISVWKHYDFVYTFCIVGEEKKNVKKSNTVTIFMRQHVYTTAEKHSSIFKLLLISFTHSLELMNPRDPWSQSFLALNIKPARVMLTLENPCCQYHGNFSDLLGNVASSLSSTR